MKTILIVCTANICRSPMAEAILRHRIAELGLAGEVSVRSAGVWATHGTEASPSGVAVLAKKGIPQSQHRSQPVTMALLDQVDIILVMEEAHRRSLFHQAPHHLGKVFLLTEMAGKHADVADPYGGSIAEYEKTAALLQDLIEAGLPGMLGRISVTMPAQGVRNRNQCGTKP